MAFLLALKGRGRYESSMAQHALVGLGSHTPFVARCSCGWLSTAASLERQAQRRWEIHVSQQRSAELCEAAWVSGACAQSKSREMAAITEYARTRRVALEQHRRQLREALTLAHESVRRFRRSTEQTLSC